MSFMDEEEYEQCLTDCRHLKSTLAKVRAQLDAITEQRDDYKAKYLMLTKQYTRDIDRYRAVLAEDQAELMIKREPVGLTKLIVKPGQRFDAMKYEAKLRRYQWFLSDRRRAAEEG